MANEGGTGFTAMDYAEPFSTIREGLVASLPTLPDRQFPVQGVRMPHGVKSRAYFVSRVPNAVTLATGLTIELAYTLAPNAKNADVGGTKTYMEVAVAGLLSGTNTLDDTCFAASGNVPTTSQSGALPTTAGVLYLHTGITITVAHCVSSDNSTALAAGSWAIIRVSRLGDNASDTNLGDIILIGFDFRNT